MKVLIVGGGIAGLAAAWRLRERGHEAVILEKDDEVGGRCRSHFWHGAWRVRGAFAFVGSEENLKDQARALGIYEPDALTDMTQNHEQLLLHKEKGLVPQPSFSPTDILKSPLLSLGEKASLARLLPKLLGQMRGNDPHDLTSAAALDEESACAYLRRLSPNFADYILEPTMQMFCGYEEDDYSIAWLLWLMAGFPWAGDWWSFKERGVGRLTYEMGRHFDNDPGTTVITGATINEVTITENVSATFTRNGAQETIGADAVVFALPAPLIPAIVPGLDEARLSFLSSVGYVGHHIAHYLLETDAKDLPETLLLPTKDGFERVSNLHFWPRDDGRIMATGEFKGQFCRETFGQSEDAILDAAWEDYLQAVPAAHDVRFVDRHLQRNDLAICRREAGFVRRLKDFRALPPHPRVAFAGDYMINSTVGQAHWSGLEAADALTA